MAAGIAIKLVASLAVRLLRIVRPVSNAATLLLLAAIGVRYFEGFVGAVGSYAIAAQLLYAVGLVLGAHAVGAGLPAGQRSVLSLGACTRNLGAALAPLLVTPPDPRAMVMVAPSDPSRSCHLCCRGLARIPAGRGTG
jgi:BASS family bile acid:Na+ symporter